VSKPKHTPRAARRGTGGVTINDVAKLAGVSAITVSRALNSPQAVSPLTLEKVRAAVSNTGYVPNLLAGGLASNRSRLVAALVPTLAGPVFLQTIQALTAELAAAGCQLMLGQSGYADSREDALIDAIVGRRPEGIVLTGIMHSPEGRRKLAASGIPIVETWDLSETPIDMLVGFSHYRAGVAVAEYLCDRGHKHPAIVTADDHRASQRRAGFAETLRARGLAAPPVYTVSAPTTFRHGRESLRHLLAEHPRIDAVFCSSDLMAHGLITEAQARGLTVPGDLAVVGFGDLDFAADLNPALTTVHIDGPTIGRQAAQFIIDRAAGRDPGPLIRDIGFSVVARASA
jgi:LacI family gluconate utilization system Gnt-I transcriptional repressor